MEKELRAELNEFANDSLLDQLFEICQGDVPAMRQRLRTLLAPSQPIANAHQPVPRVDRYQSLEHCNAVSIFTHSAQPITNNVYHYYGEVPPSASGSASDIAGPGSRSDGDARPRRRHRRSLSTTNDPVVVLRGNEAPRYQSGENMSPMSGSTVSSAGNRSGSSRKRFRQVFDRNDGDERQDDGDKSRRRHSTIDDRQTRSHHDNNEEDNDEDEHVDIDVVDRDDVEMEQPVAATATTASGRTTRSSLARASSSSSPLLSPTTAAAAAKSVAAPILVPSGDGAVAAATFQCTVCNESKDWQREGYETALPLSATATVPCRACKAKSATWSSRPRDEIAMHAYEHYALAEWVHQIGDYSIANRFARVNANSSCFFQVMWSSLSIADRKVRGFTENSRVVTVGNRVLNKALELMPLLKVRVAEQPIYLRGIAAQMSNATVAELGKALRVCQGQNQRLVLDLLDGVVRHRNPLIGAYIRFVTALLMRINLVIYSCEPQPERGLSLITRMSCAFTPSASSKTPIRGEPVIRALVHFRTPQHEYRWLTPHTERARATEPQLCSIAHPDFEEKNEGSGSEESDASHHHRRRRRSSKRLRT
jgi:hypothetical protein